MLRSGRALVALAIVCAASVGTIFGGAPPAGACSCIATSVATRVRGADAVYIARPRTAHLLSGVSFRIERVLKGPAEHNVRVRIFGGDEAACGTTVVSTPYVLTSNEGRFTPLNLCTEDLRGPRAVQAATAILGPGRPVAGRRDAVWLLQWGIPAAVVLVLGLVGALLVRRRRKVLGSENPTPS